VGLPAREIGTVSALRKDTAAIAGAHIEYAVADDRTGVAIPARYFSHDGKAGLERISGSSATQTDAQINFTLSNRKALPPEFSGTWDGVLSVPAIGRYTLHMEILSAYGSLKLDDKTVAQNGKMFVHGDITQAGETGVMPTTDGLDNVSQEVDLTAGSHKLSLAVTPDGSHQPVQIRLSWLTPDQESANYQAAIDAAKRAKTAIVFVWAQGDPRFNLPGDQNKLVEDVAAVNPNTIVVLNVSQPVDLPWLDKVKAVLQMWWPGDEGGWATADVLLGKVSPAGRLPFTWAHSLTDYPATDPAHPERGGTNASGTGIFSEGIYIGYRWFDKQNIQPLFPFGFGLTYTHFKYSNLKLMKAGEGVDVSFSIANTGRIGSDEVPQVYLGPPNEQPTGTQFALRSLAAFDRIHVNAGQSRIVRFHVPERCFQYWSTNANQWETGTGKRTVYVGPSSRELPLQATISY
jgi:beta-glucosidase